MRKVLLLTLAAAMTVSAGCSAAGISATGAAESSAAESGAADAREETAGGAGTAESAEARESASPEEVQETPAFSEKVDMARWHYENNDDVYWQVGIPYCSRQADASYETMGIFVPGSYFSAEPNGDGTYSCEINTSGTVKGYKADSAPVVLPVNTPGYSAQKAPEGYSEDIADYTKEGFIYLYPGCRGRDAGAPAGVTDLKAAIRFFRHNEDVLPGDMDAVFTFGMSGGGAQSAVLGASGDSGLYLPYLEAIGAITGEDSSDAVLGSMCWCPITSLNDANGAYEWNLGMTRSGLTEEEQALSDGLALRFAEYQNGLALTDEDGNVLALEPSAEGIYQAGSYYEYVKAVIETSLNHFLEDTEFPVELTGRRGGGRGGNARPGGGPGPGGNGGPKEGAGAGAGKPEQDFTQIDQISRTAADAGLTITGTFEDPMDYVDALNAEEEWVIYDPESNTAEITDVESFVRAFKNASKGLGAFDQLDKGQGENELFGYGDGEGAHFDPVMAELLAGTDYAEEFEKDLARKDALGSSAETRVAMYSPLYYLNPTFEGYRTSGVAPYWRIRTGINQGDTALTTEINLALALNAFDGVDVVDFETVWGEGHTMAERTGNSTENFIEWVREMTE